VYGLGIKEKDFYEKNKVNSMKDKNKEAIKIVEENRLTNIYSPEDKIRMEIENIDKQVDHTKVDDRGSLDLTRKIDELEKENADLKYDNKSLAKQVEDKVEEVKALKMKLELLDNKT